MLMTPISTHLKSIPGFASGRERNLWFVASVLALLVGLWFSVAWIRFQIDPAIFDLSPTSKIPYGWLIGAMGFVLGGGIGVYLGFHRLNNTPD